MWLLTATSLNSSEFSRVTFDFHILFSLELDVVGSGPAVKVEGCFASRGQGIDIPRSPFVCVFSQLSTLN